MKGDEFDPNIVNHRIGINSTEQWKKGDKGIYAPILKYSCWKYSTEMGREYLQVDILVDEIVNKLFDKIEAISSIKKEFDLDSVLEIVMFVDMNDEEHTPELGHDLKTIEFLYKTQTITDVDIYRFDSRK